MSFFDKYYPAICLGMLAAATAVDLYAANRGNTVFYWLAAMSACFFSFIAGSEWSKARWKPIADDAIACLHEVNTLLKRSLEQRRTGQ